MGKLYPLRISQYWRQPTPRRRCSPCQALSRWRYPSVSFGPWPSHPAWAISDSSAALLLGLGEIVQAQHGLQVVEALLETEGLQVVRGDREQVAQVLQHLPAQAHEPRLLAVLRGLEYDVGFDVADDLVVTEYRVLGEEHEVCDLLLVIHGHRALLDEVELAELLPIVDNSRPIITTYYNC